jgi:hypothetical protein
MPESIGAARNGGIAAVLERQGRKAADGRWSAPVWDERDGLVFRLLRKGPFPA